MSGRSHSWAKMMVTALRSFFRFLLQSGEIDANLAAAVPAVPGTYHLSTLPKGLSTEEVEGVLAACDQSTPKGRRDHAILLLLARYGLRAGDVVGLCLDDINWRAGEITVSGKRLVSERLPLLPDVGQALVVYLRTDRPQIPTRRVFLTMHAPLGGFHGSQAIGTIVRDALVRAGLNPPRKGAHLMRHSLAMGMMRSGASLAEIGGVLGHRCSQTTELYAKVDVGGLRSLGRPWLQAGGAL